MTKIKINFYMHSDLCATDISVLGLNENTKNTLKRNRIDTIGDILANYDRLPQIKNLGNKKLTEVHTKLFDTYVNYLELNGYTDELDAIFDVEYGQAVV